MIPPLSLWLRIVSPTRRDIRLWLPLFLLWLLLLPLAVLALALAIVTDLVLFLLGQAYHRFTLLLLGCMRVLASSRGLVVRVNNGLSTVNITVS